MKVPRTPPHWPWESGSCRSGGVYAGRVKGARGSTTASLKATETEESSPWGRGGVMRSGVSRVID